MNNTLTYQLKVIRNKQYFELTKQTKYKSWIYRER